MPVRDVMRTHTSRDIAGWMAYEKAFGDIGGLWTTECLAEMHELLQNMLYVSGAQAEQNPFPKPHMKERPLVLQPLEDDDEDVEPEQQELIPDELFEEEG